MWRRRRRPDAGLMPAFEGTRKQAAAVCRSASGRPATAALVAGCRQRVCLPVVALLLCIMAMDVQESQMCCTRMLVPRPRAVLLRVSTLSRGTSEARRQAAEPPGECGDVEEGTRQVQAAAAGQSVVQALVAGRKCRARGLRRPAPGCRQGLPRAPSNVDAAGTPGDVDASPALSHAGSAMRYIASMRRAMLQRVTRPGPPPR